MSKPEITEPAALDQARKMYDSLKDYEHHFNKMELEIRKLASIWLLAVFSAIAFVARGELSSDAMIAPAAMIPLLAALGSTGLFMLWIQDYVVYHGLMRAVFILGLRLEFDLSEFPPLRSVMMRISGDEGMGRYMKLYYIVPQVVLSGIAVAVVLLNEFDWAGIVFTIAATGFTFATIRMARHVHTNYVTYAKEFELAPPTTVADEFARMMDAEDRQVTFANTVARWRYNATQRAAAVIDDHDDQANKH